MVRITLDSLKAKLKTRASRLAKKVDQDSLWIGDMQVKPNTCPPLVPGHRKTDLKDYKVSGISSEKRRQVWAQEPHRKLSALELRWAESCRSKVEVPQRFASLTPLVNACVSDAFCYSLRL